ncbi:type 1 glutamine amidotransferase family protein [Anaerostipes faecis]|uniref:type 1 glutamine amidotransferase family protein n=1 Tax=Anaerostipes faecis TaxID=2880702 RepID=UPI0011DE325F|nr:type 1 glutamine amidotransferase family protein [Anaerostipes faecis]
MEKEVLVFIFDGYADWEPAYVCAELNSPHTQYVVKTIGLVKEPVISMGGFQIVPNYSINDYPEEFSLLILTGGYAWLQQKNNEILPVVEYAVKKHIPVGAICNATNFMAEHGYLNQIKHSGNTLEFMKSQAPHYTGEKHFIQKQAVCDRNIITANGSGALEFAREILLLLNVKTQSDISKWYLENKAGMYPYKE